MLIGTRTLCNGIIPCSRKLCLRVCLRILVFPLNVGSLNVHSMIIVTAYSLLLLVWRLRTIYSCQSILSISARIKVFVKKKLFYLDLVLQARFLKTSRLTITQIMWSKSKDVTYAS